MTENQIKSDLQNNGASWQEFQMEPQISCTQVMVTSAGDIQAPAAMTIHPVEAITVITVKVEVDDGERTIGIAYDRLGPFAEKCRAAAWISLHKAVGELFA